MCGIMEVLSIASPILGGLMSKPEAPDPVAPPVAPIAAPIPPPVAAPASESTLDAAASTDAAVQRQKDLQRRQAQLTAGSTSTSNYVTGSTRTLLGS